MIGFNIFFFIKINFWPLSDLKISFLTQLLLRNFCYTLANASWFTCILYWKGKKRPRYASAKVSTSLSSSFSLFACRRAILLLHAYYGNICEIYDVHCAKNIRATYSMCFNLICILLQTYICIFVHFTCVALNYNDLFVGNF